MKKFILGFIIGALLASAFFMFIKPTLLDDNAKEIGIGTYICSKDIEIGKYQVKVKAGKGENLEEVIVSTFSSSGSELTKYSINGDGETFVNLEEGMIMKIENANSGIEVGKITIKKVDKIK